MHDSVRWKKCLELLTPETRKVLQDEWDKVANDLLERDGNNAEYPDHHIKHNEPLIKAIQRAFEGYMCVFIERSIDESNYQNDQQLEHSEWVVSRYTLAARETIRKLIPDQHSKSISNAIVGSIIRRAIDVFAHAFPQYPRPEVAGYSIFKDTSRWDFTEPPDAKSR